LRGVSQLSFVPRWTLPEFTVAVAARELAADAVPGPVCVGGAFWGRAFWWRGMLCAACGFAVSAGSVAPWHSVRVKCDLRGMEMTRWPGLRLDDGVAAGEAGAASLRLRRRFGFGLGGWRRTVVSSTSALAWGRRWELCVEGRGGQHHFVSLTGLRPGLHVQRCLADFCRMVGNRSPSAGVAGIDRAGR